MTSDETLSSLSTYGAPTLFQMGFGKAWCCKVAMSVDVIGVTFEVKAQGPTPNEALATCHANMVEALRGLGTPSAEAQSSARQDRQRRAMESAKRQMPQREWDQSTA